VKFANVSALKVTFHLMKENMKLIRTRPYH